MGIGLGALFGRGSLEQRGELAVELRELRSIDDSLEHVEAAAVVRLTNRSVEPSVPVEAKGPAPWSPR